MIMIEDPIVAEIRAARRAIAREAKGDLRLAFERARKLEEVWATWRHDPVRVMAEIRARRSSAQSGAG